VVAKGNNPAAQVLAFNLSGVPWQIEDLLEFLFGEPHRGSTSDIILRFEFSSARGEAPLNDGDTQLSTRPGVLLVLERQAEGLIFRVEPRCSLATNGLDAWIVTGLELPGGQAKIPSNVVL